MQLLLVPRLLPIVLAATLALESGLWLPSDPAGQAKRASTYDLVEAVAVDVPSSTSLVRCSFPAM